MLFPYRPRYWPGRIRPVVIFLPLHLANADRNLVVSRLTLKVRPRPLLKKPGKLGRPSKLRDTSFLLSPSFYPGPKDSPSHPRKNQRRKCTGRNKPGRKESNPKEQIGYHKGALATLAKEREEFMRVLQVVEELMKVHIKALQDLGVDLTSGGSGGKSGKPAKKDAKPIEDLL